MHVNPVVERTMEAGTEVKIFNLPVLTLEKAQRDWQKVYPGVLQSPLAKAQPACHASQGVYMCFFRDFSASAGADPELRSFGRRFLNELTEVRETLRGCELDDLPRGQRDKFQIYIERVGQRAALMEDLLSKGVEAANRTARRIRQDALAALK